MSELDTRFPPRPETIAVPLYPTKDAHITSVDVNSERDLGIELQTVFGCDYDQLVVGDSASSLLRAYLTSMTELSDGEEPKVGIPAFCCQSVVDAVIDSGSIPVFYDVDDTTCLSAESVDFLQGEGCDVCLWPSFFGSRPREQVLIDSLHESGISIIYDEAQANPFSELATQTRADLSKGDIAIYSFGISKMLAGSGGGAIYDKHISESLVKIREQIVGEAERPVRAGVSSDTPNYLKLDALLEFRTHEGSPHTRIAPHDAQVALRQLGCMAGAMDKHAENYIDMAQVVNESLGDNALRYLSAVEGVPSILAVSLPPAKRYEFMASMSEQAIQTTWYYYPLDRVRRYSDYANQTDIGGLAVAKSIVVLPFQWTHSQEQLDRVQVAIQAAAKEIQ